MSFTDKEKSMKSHYTHQSGSKDHKMFCKETEEIFIVSMDRISKYTTDETTQKILNTF